MSPRTDAATGEDFGWEGEATGLARRMVREWGMSEKIGPMAFGGGGPVFLGDDMMQSREYSEELASLIDHEVQALLTEQENRCRDLLTTHRKALNLVARGLLEHETLSGAEVKRLIGVAMGIDNPTPPAAPGSLDPSVDTIGSSLDS